MKKLYFIYSSSLTILEDLENKEFSVDQEIFYYHGTEPLRVRQKAVQKIVEFDRDIESISAIDPSNFVDADTFRKNKFQGMQSGSYNMQLNIYRLDEEKIDLLSKLGISQSPFPLISDDDFFDSCCLDTMEDDFFDEFTKEAEHIASHLNDHSIYVVVAYEGVDYKILIGSPLPAEFIADIS